MGWTFFSVSEHEKTRDIINREFSQSAGERIICGEKCNFPAISIVDLSIRGREAYIITRTELESGPQYNAGVILFTRKNGEFGYKDISEDCGPYANHAPLRMIDFLDKVKPVPAESSAGKWRANCRANAKKIAEKIELKPGQIVRYGGKDYQLIGPAGPRMGWRVSIAGHSAIYRMNSRQLSRAELIN